MIIIVQGTVGIYTGHSTPDEKQTESLGTGDFFGEQSLFAGLPSSYTAVTLEPMVGVVVTRDNVNKFFTTQPEMAFKIVSRTCLKVESLNREHEILIDDVRAGIATKKLQAAEAKASRSSKLFPEGHSSYFLPIDNAQDEYLYSHKTICYVCGFGFNQLYVINSKLRRLGNPEPDLRVRYKDVEPMFYDIVSCPGCMFSAEREAFEGASKRLAPHINDELGRFRSELYLRAGYDRDSFTVFAGYYLAILCAPHVHIDYQIEQAGLWHRLSRIYSDQGDSTMTKFASLKALETYRYSYENIRLSPKREQQVAYFIGDFLQRIGELDTAREFFYTVKTSKTNNNVIKRHAELRLDEIKELIRQAKQQ